LTELDRFNLVIGLTELGAEILRSTTLAV
jgi:hypothetical protein